MIYVIDSADKERLPKARTYLHRVLTDKDLKDAPILVMANKQDKEGAMSAEEVFKELNLEQVEKKDLCLQGCSAMTGDGIWEGIK